MFILTWFWTFLQSGFFARFSKLANNKNTFHNASQFFPLQQQPVRREYGWWELKCSQSVVLKEGESKRLIAINL